MAGLQENEVGKIRIVIADGNPIYRSGLQLLLGQVPDLEVIGAATNGEEALAIVTQHIPDVVLIDVSLAKLDGIEVTRKIRVLKYHTVVLILTSLFDESFVLPALQAKVDGYLSKSIDIPQLAECIRVAHSGQTLLARSITAMVCDHLAYTHSLPVGDDERTGLNTLCNRERQVLNLVAEGLSNRAIASHLSLSERTVQSHLGNIYNKLRVNCRTEAVTAAMKQGLLVLAAN